MIKGFLIGSALVLAAFQGYSQGCDCPPVNTCGTCQGGIVELTLRNNGPLALISAYDGGDLRYFGWVNTGNSFTVTGSLWDGRFQGNDLDIHVVGLPVTTISTNCGAGVYINSVFGNFTVVNGESKNGGTLCCSPANTDNIRPTISGCPMNIQVALNPPGCSIPVNWTPPTADDNCGDVVLTSTHSPGYNFTKGTTPVVYTATDDYGNTTTCSFTVTVINNSNPIITGCPTNITVAANASCRATANWTPPSVAGNCGTVTLTRTHTPGSIFSLGTTAVTYTATDDVGRTSTCTFNVTVVDNTKPVISGCFPSGISAIADGSCKATVNWIAPTATDNCVSVSMISTHKPGDKFPIGITPVTYTATDAAGNFSLCTFNVTVTDATAPVFAGCTDVVVQAGQSCQAKATWTPPTVTDCSPVTVSSSHNSGDFFPVGTTEVTYSASDGKGNTSTCKFKIIVEDKLPPAFNTCNADVIATAADNCAGVVQWTVPMATDNCGAVQVTSSHAPGETFPIGTTEVKYTALDQHGNSSVCKFNVIVKIETPPVIANCPGEIHLKGDELGEAPADWIEPTATTVCGDLTLTSSHQPGDIFSVGTTEVQYQAKDISGNISTCKFNVVVTRQEIILDIGKVVTPDGNGVNDEWVVKNIEKFTNNKITIVDRWGSVIFSAAGYNNESVVWKGQNRNGNMVPNGTYFYTISVRYGPSVFEKSGFIELIR